MHPLFRCRLSGLVALCRLRLARRSFRLGLFWRWLYLSVGLHGFVGSCSICRLLGSSIGEQINLLRLARLYLCSLLLDSLCRRFRLIDTGLDKCSASKRNQSVWCGVVPRSVQLCVGW